MPAEAQAILQSVPAATAGGQLPRSCVPAPALSVVSPLGREVRLQRQHSLACVQGLPPIEPNTSVVGLAAAPRPRSNSSCGRPKISCYPQADSSVRLEAPRPHIRVSAVPKHLTWPLPISLPNLGNTCYMNSVMQCLRQSPSLLSSLDKHQLSAASQPAAAAMLQFFRMSEGDPKEYLLTFKSEAAKCNDEFKDFTQADGHEFLRTFLLVVHNEINSASRSKSHGDELGDIGKEDEATALRRWREQFARYDNSLIYDLFGGVTLATCCCLACGNSSRTFEAFLDLSLPVKQRTCHGVNVEEVVMENFVEAKEERMSGSNRIFCSCCNGLREVRRRVVVREWPRLLVLHLKRFDEYGRKDLSSVIYPETFMTGGERPRQYKLYGVLMHSGTEVGGHYTSYVRVAYGEWYLCDDGVIKPSQPADVMQQLETAYILFYTCGDAG